jgi:threonyl-tRNA synthetase
VLSGLTRVREIHLDDTHVFCRPDQVGDEAARGLRAALRAQEVLGLPVDYVRLSLRDDSGAWLGSDEQWADAERRLRAAAERVLVDSDVDLVAAAGEAAFYGPKLDLQVVDGNGHEETIATVQLDFVQPQRFDLRYDGADGESHPVVMIHRGTVGSMERVTAALLERYDGRMPLWLNPVQLRVLPVSESADAVAREFVDALRSRGLRAELDVAGSLGGRIRASHARRDHAFAVLGEAEIATNSVQLTDAASGWRGSLERGIAIDILAEAHAARSAPAWP